MSDRTTAAEQDFYWTGVTYFREVREQDEDEVDEWTSWSPAVVQGLIRGVGAPGKPALENDLSVIGIERDMLVRKQMESLWFGPIYAVVEAEGRGEDARQAPRSYHIENPDGLEGRRADSIIKASQRYEILDGLLMTRVHDA